MEEKVVTIVVLPYARAVELKQRLEDEGVACELEDISLTEDAVASVRVKISEKDLGISVPVLDDFLGKKDEKLKRVEKSNDHVLVPVDFSPVSLKTTKLAFSIASHLQVKLVLMHCYINPAIHSAPYADVYVYDSALLARMEDSEKSANDNFAKFLEKLIAEIGRKKWQSVDSEFIIKPGYADEDILSFSRQNNSRVIVMGTGGEAELTMGSVTADVIYNAKVPVLVIPEGYPEKELPEFKRVLYATNFDTNDFRTINKLIGLLKPFDVKVFCVHVGKKECTDWDKARLEGMRKILSEKYEKKEFNCRFIPGDDILETLQEFIDGNAIDIISLTTRKRNMISRLFNPSVARKMVFHSKLPLLVFHA